MYMYKYTPHQFLSKNTKCRRTDIFKIRDFFFGHFWKITSPCGDVRQEPLTWVVTYVSFGQVSHSICSKNNSFEHIEKSRKSIFKTINVWLFWHLKNDRTLRASILRYVRNSQRPSEQKKILTYLLLINIITLYIPYLGVYRTLSVADLKHELLCLRVPIVYQRLG